VATIFVDFVAGLTTDAPLGAAAVTFNSPGLADLPEVTSGDVVKVCFNPEAVGDPPEIAYVTAHAALATSATILRGQEGTTGTEWAASTDWTTVLTADDIDDLREAGGSSPGDIKSGIWSAAPTGWLLLDGSAVADADDNYPDLWAVVPAAWKSGSTLNLPDMTEDRALLGGGTLGAEAGANTHTLVTANLPAHSHTFSDTSTSSLTTHTHSFSGTTNIDGAHTHNLEYNAFAVSAGGEWLAQRIADDGTPAQGTSTSVTHDHTFSGTTGASASLAHTHDVSGTTSETGSSTAVDHTPKHLRVNWAIKT
jgi:microcystin-dependent protein